VRSSRGSNHVAGKVASRRLQLLGLVREVKAKRLGDARAGGERASGHEKLGLGWSFFFRGKRFGWSDRYRSAKGDHFFQSVSPTSTPHKLRWGALLGALLGALGGV